MVHLESKKKAERQSLRSLRKPKITFSKRSPESNSAGSIISGKRSRQKREQNRLQTVLPVEPPRKLSSQKKIEKMTGMGGGACLREKDKTFVRVGWGGEIFNAT